MPHEQVPASDYTRLVGEEFREREWILTPLNTWERNPFYTGPQTPHPVDCREG
jgi:hypothetical protein